MRVAASSIGLVLILAVTTAARPANVPPPAPLVQTCDEAPPDDYVQTISGLVDGDELVLAVSARFGGAVESVTWRGKEFINIFDHGRQISYAWQMDGYGECLNPTEPGSASDLFAPSSTSDLLSVCRSAENVLTTTTQPAFWLAPGETGFCDRGTTAANDTLISDHIMEKTVEIGYGGIDNVISFTITVDIPRDHDRLQLEIPTAYLTHEFTGRWVYNPQSGELIEAEPQPLHEPWSFFHLTNLPVILATPDGEYAMGAYTTEAIEYYSILFYDIPNPDDRTNKWNMVLLEQPAPAGAYTYQSFAVVGTLAEVQSAMSELFALEPADFNPPEGYVDLASCDEIAGWAWDPKAPDQPINIEIYSVGEDGSETLLTRTTADIFRSDLPPVLGDNGEHGYSIPTSDVLPDDEPYTLHIYAVNSDARSPNPSLFPREHTLECPQLAPVEEPEQTEEPATEAPADDPAPEVADDTDGGGVGGGSGLPCLGSALPLLAGLAFVTNRRWRSYPRKLSG